MNIAKIGRPRQSIMQLTHSSAPQKRFYGQKIGLKIDFYFLKVNDVFCKIHSAGKFCGFFTDCNKRFTLLPIAEAMGI